MAMQIIIISRKLIIYLGILILCVLTGIDDLSGLCQQLNSAVPIIQSGNGQEDGGDHKVTAIHPAWRDTINVSQQLSFSKACLEEIKWQVNPIHIRSSHNRAPPSFS